MTKRTPNRNLRAAFTLIEIMVVIAILSALSAIIFVVWSGAKTKAREARCRSNLSQFAVAFRQFANEHNGKFPDWGSEREGWIEKISPYINKQILICPSDVALAGSPDGKVESEPDRLLDPLSAAAPSSSDDWAYLRFSASSADRAAFTYSLTSLGSDAAGS